MEKERNRKRRPSKIGEEQKEETTEDGCRNHNFCDGCQRCRTEVEGRTRITMAFHFSQMAKTKGKKLQLQRG